MGSRTNTRIQLPAWAWWLAYLLGWPAAMALVLALFQFVIVDTGRVGTVGFAAVLTAVAWTVARLSGRAGAPPLTWTAVLLGSLPLEGLLALGLVGSDDPLHVVGWALSLLVPPLVTSIELRRQTAAAVSRRRTDQDAA